MKKTKLILVSTLLASGLVSGYSEENDNTSIFRTTNHNEQKISNLALPASHLIGEKVVNYKGENLGKVKEIMINPNTGKVAYVVVSYGGFFRNGR